MRSAFLERLKFPLLILVLLIHVLRVVLLIVHNLLVGVALLLQRRCPAPEERKELFGE